VLQIGITPDGANEIARRARGTPRIAGRLLRRVRDFASAADAASIDRAIADNALSALEVDAAGLDAMDRRYLSTIAMNYGGGPRRRRNHGGGVVGAARRHRGHHRALSDPVRLSATHPAGSSVDPRTLSGISASPSPRATRRNSDCSGAEARTATTETLLTFCTGVPEFSLQFPVVKTGASRLIIHDFTLPSIASR